MKVEGTRNDSGEGRGGGKIPRGKCTKTYVGNHTFPCV